MAQRREEVRAAWEKATLGLLMIYDLPGQVRIYGGPEPNDYKIRVRYEGFKTCFAHSIAGLRCHGLS